MRLTVIANSVRVHAGHMPNISAMFDFNPDDLASFTKAMADAAAFMFNHRNFKNEYGF